jgi:hypothetical protein
VIVPRHWLVWLSDLLVGIRGGGWPGRAAKQQQIPSFCCYTMSRTLQGRLRFIYPLGAAKTRLLMDGSGEGSKTLGVAIGRDVVSEQYGKAGLVGHRCGRLRGGDGVNIRKAYVWASCCSPGRRSQPGVLSITRFPDWTEPDVLQIARQGCQGLIVTINPAGSRVWSGPGATRKCRGLTS